MVTACGGQGYVKVVVLPEDEDDELDIALMSKDNPDMVSMSLTLAEVEGERHCRC